MLTSQYESIKSARRALFAYFANMNNDALFKKAPVFNDKSISYLLLHNANTYISWIDNFGLDGNIAFHNIEDFKTLNDIELIYEQVDQIVNDFLKKYSVDYSQSLTKYIARKGITITLTPLQLFTHVITHEFHHKGQMITMSRLLGHTPGDTDTIRF